MSNKQSSVEWLIEHYTFADLTAESWEMIQQQAKAMHKQEIIDARQDGYESTYSTCDSGCGGGFEMESTNEQYYNEKYGGKNEQQ